MLKQVTSFAAIAAIPLLIAYYLLTARVEPGNLGLIWKSDTLEILPPGRHYGYSAIYVDDVTPNRMSTTFELVTLSKDGIPFRANVSVGYAITEAGLRYTHNRLRGDAPLSTGVVPRGAILQPFAVATAREVLANADMRAIAANSPDLADSLARSIQVALPMAAETTISSVQISVNEIGTLR